VTWGLAFALAAAAGAALWIAVPLLGRRALEVERASASLGRARELQSRREQLLASLRDLEDDRATDKIDEGDYAATRARLEGQAIEVLRELDVLESERERERAAERRAHEPLPYPGGRGAGRPR
jgi:hypothetical protein